MSAKFPLGRLAATPAALKALEESGQEPGFFLSRHVAGDWGDDLCDEDRRLNDEALVHGDRLLSSFRTLRGAKLWIITEAVDDAGNRAATTILLPEDY